MTPCDICKAEDCQYNKRVRCYCPCHGQRGKKRSFDKDIAVPIKPIRKDSAVLQTWRDRRPSPQFYRAWAIITQNPQITRREFSRALGCEWSGQGQYWIKKLEEAGVIRRGGKNLIGAIEVLIPFAYQKAKRRT